jgi:hypothetical protein
MEEPGKLETVNKRQNNGNRCHIYLNGGFFSSFSVSGGLVTIFPKVLWVFFTDSARLIDDIVLRR